MMILKKIKITVFLLAVLVAFASCNKESVATDENTQVQNNNDILYFDSSEEYFAELEKVQSMNHWELKAYEESKGYESFGRKSEEFYRNVNWESFNSKEELFAFVEKNSNYLQLIELENGEFKIETKLYESSARYFADENKVYQIKDRVFKVLEKGKVSGKETGIEKVMAVNDDNLDSFIGDDELSVNLFKQPKNGLKDVTTHISCGDFIEKDSDTNQRKGIKHK